MIYSCIFILLQSLFNILHTSGSESYLLYNLGFHNYEYYCFYIGVQCIPIFILAFFWRIRKTQKQQQMRMLRTPTVSDSTTFISDPSNNENRGNSDGKKAKKKRSLSLKEKIQKLFLDSSDNILYFLRVCWKIFLENSYYFTLLSLLLCSLIQINLFNFGYLCFFVLFLMSRRIAHHLWIVLVLYTGCVIMIIYLWQITWTEDLDSTWVAELFGLKHFEHAITGLIVSLTIYLISLVQLVLIRVENKQSKSAPAKHSSAVQVSEMMNDDGARGDDHNNLFEFGPITKMILNSFEVMLKTSNLWICYIALFISSMIIEYSLFAM